MPWIARDKTGTNPYRIFGNKPKKLLMVSYDGEIQPDRYTWSFDEIGKISSVYGPLSNNENTMLPEDQSPVYLEPGEGPIEIKLSLSVEVSARLFEGEGI